MSSDKNVGSLWNETIQLPSFPSFSGNLKTDVLIIGGGMAGLLCAYFLNQAGIDYALVEANTIASGITKNTTAKITSQHGLIYEKIAREYGIEKARQYLEINEQAVAEYRKMCQNIDCDFETKDSYVYSIHHREKLENEIKVLGRVGYAADFVDRTSLPFATQGAVRFSNQAQFHPLKFMAAIAPSLHIFEQTKVTELGVRTAKTDHGMITAESIVDATHFPMNNKHGAYFLKMYQRRSYVLALSAPQNMNELDVHGMYVDEAQDGLSFRNYKDLLLLGGGGHRTGKQGGDWNELLDVARCYYPYAKEQYRWATQDCMTLDHIPYIGTYGSHTQGFYVTTGFNKWGMSTSMVSAMLLRDQLLGKPNEYATLFNPHRSMMHPQLVANAFEATTNLLSFSTKRCPHLGCALKWNEEEHSWDCPCHGSRFTKQGDLIDNPATDDLKQK